MAGQILSKGPKKWLVRVFLGRDGAGKKKYVSRLVHGGKKKCGGKKLMKNRVLAAGPAFVGDFPAAGVITLERAFWS